MPQTRRTPGRVAVGRATLVAGIIALAALGVRTAAQQQPRPGVGPLDRPKVDAEAATRGGRVWVVECVTCHGAQARGTESGSNLIRSTVVLRDRYGSELGPFLKKGHPLQSGAPSSSLTDTQVTDLTHFLRQRIEDTLRGSVKFVPQHILVGDAAAGARYFAGAGGCTQCHSATGDLAGIATRIPNPVDLQQRAIFPTGRGGRGAIRVTLTPAGGTPLSGTLEQMDDFYVTLRDDEGRLRVVRRSASLAVTKENPLQAHIDRLRTITDEEMHDLVAYLVTLK